MVKCVLPLSLMLLTGCAVAPPNPSEPSPVMVKVPVYEPIYCATPKLERPVLPVGALRPDSLPADTMKAYAATVAILKGAVDERDEVIAGCEKPGGGGTNDAAAAPSHAEVEGASITVTNDQSERRQNFFSLLRGLRGNE